MESHEGPRNGSPSDSPQIPGWGHRFCRCIYLRSEAREKISLACIGCGTQELTEMVGMLPMPEIQIVAVCDPNRYTEDYVEWGKDSVRRQIAAGIGKPEWRQGIKGCPGGRDVGQEVGELFYSMAAEVIPAGSGAAARKGWHGRGGARRNKVALEVISLDSPRCIS